MTENLGGKGKSNIFTELRKKVRDTTRAGLAAGALAGALPATMQHEIPIPTIEFQQSEVGPRTPQEELVYRRARQLIEYPPKSSDPKDSNLGLIRALYSSGAQPGLLLQTTPRVAADVTLVLLHDPRYAADFANIALAASRVFDEDTRTPEILMKAAELTKSWRIGRALNNAAVKERPWVPELLDRVAQQMDRSTFLQTFGSPGATTFADLPEEIQGRLRETMQRHYANDDTQKLVEAWSALAQKPDRDSEKLRDTFARQGIGNLYTLKERVDFMEQFATLLENAPNRKLHALHTVQFLEKYEKWWSGDPRSEEILKTLLLDLAAQGDAWSLLRDYVRPLYQGKEWAGRIDLLLNDCAPWVIYQHYQHFKAYSWADEKLALNVAVDPNSVVKYFDSFRESPQALEVLKKALPLADGVLGLKWLERESALLTAAQREDLKSALPKNIPTEIALLANSINPLYKNLRKDPGLVDMDKIDRTLVLPLVAHPNVNEAWWNERTDWFRDQDVRHRTAVVDMKMALLRDLAAKYNGKNPIGLEESAAIVARNLAQRGDQVTAESVRAEVARIRDMRELLASVDLFKRNVLLVSHEEVLGHSSRITPTMQKGMPRFGTQALVDTLKSRQGGGFSFDHATPLSQINGAYETNFDSLKRAKDKTLATITTSLAPLTVYFDGHGGPDAMYFSDGQAEVVGQYFDDVKGQLITEHDKQRILETQKTTKITVDELADALAARFKAQRATDPEARMNISFVFSACFMQNFARLLAEGLKERGVPLPEVMISASEFGQYGFSDFDSAYGSKFNELMLKNRDLKTIIDSEDQYFESNPSVIVPAKDSPALPMQISGAQIYIDTVTA